MDELKAHAFELEEKTAGIDTAFRAVGRSGKDGPSVAILAEYDALPDILVTPAATISSVLQPLGRQ